MSETIKFTLSDENYEELLKRAGNQSIQDYIRSILFPNQTSPITPEIAVTKALVKYSKGDRFSVPEIFGDDWSLANGYAGVLGRRFCKLVNSDYSDKIKFTETFNRKGHAIYEIIKEGEIEMNTDETKKALGIIEHNPECIAWKDFNDRGNACTGRLDILTSANDIQKNAISLSNVKQAMPKHSELHIKLSPKVASEVGAKWVTYDWLTKILARILEDDYITFVNMFNLSIYVKRKMKEKGLVEISTVAEVMN